MALEILGFALLGCVCGIFTGLFPGIHTNTVALIALKISWLGSPNTLAFVASMSVVHTFVDFVPSILFGAPSTDTFLGVLPGHRMLMQGNGLEAVKLSVMGGLFAGIVSIAISPLFLISLERISNIMQTLVPFVLTAILALMILDERGKNIALAVVVIVSSAVLGVLALGNSLPLKEPLLCLAAGFFGASTLIDSILRNAKVVKQEKKGFFVEREKALKGSFLALLGGWIVSMLPGIGASQAAFIMRKLFGQIGDKGYLVLLGGTNTSTMILSFFVLFAWGKTRTGSAAAMNQLGFFGADELLLVMGASLLAIGFGAAVTGTVASEAAKLLAKVDYRKINIAVLCLVSITVVLFCGVLGILFYVIACLIGLVAINSGTKRANCMAFLMVPTIMHYISGFI